MPEFNAVNRSLLQWINARRPQWAKRRDVYQCLDFVQMLHAYWLFAVAKTVRPRKALESRSCALTKRSLHLAFQSMWGWRLRRWAWLELGSGCPRWAVNVELHPGKAGTMRRMSYRLENLPSSEVDTTVFGGTVAETVLYSMGEFLSKKIISH